MPRYKDLFNSGNVFGYHTFTGTILTAIVSSGVTVSTVAVTGGENVTMSAGAITVVGFLDRQGRIGPRDLNLDVLIVQIPEVKKFPDAAQDQIFAFEKLPTGFGAVSSLIAGTTP
jgi:hypothetical protein